MVRWPVQAATALFVATAVPLGVGLLGSPAVAATSVVSVQPGATLKVVSDDGANDISVFPSSERIDTFTVLSYRVHDNAGTLTPTAPDCQAVDASTVWCTRSAVSQYQVFAFGGNDKVDMSALSIPGQINGGLGDDTLTGGSGDETLFDGAGTGNFGNDTLNGGGGKDTADYSGHSAITGGTAGIALTLDGVANDGTTGESDNVKQDIEVVIGTNYNDNLTGSNNVDFLRGGDGDDTLEGAGGGDFLGGGNGVDTVSYASHTGPVQVRLGGDANAGEPGENDSIEPDIENVTGSPGNDALTDADPSLTTTNVLRGGGGNDVLDANGLPTGDAPTQFFGDGGTDTVTYASRGATPVFVTIDNVADDGAHMSGGPGGGTMSEGDNVHDDVENLIGTAAADSLAGSLANTVSNVLDGGTGGDTLSGGGGVDTVTYANRMISVRGSIDNVADDGASGENDNIKTDIENVTGGFGNDTLVGSPSVANVLTGGDGDDSFSGNTGADVFNGGNGVDTVTYSERFAPLKVFVDGSANDGESNEGDNVKTDIENVVGGNGNDLLIGSAAANALSGGPGSDTLSGGAGADVFNGGTGTDRVSYSNATSSLTVTIDNAANDGPAGEGDNVKTDVENLTGGPSNDVLIGSSAKNTFAGGSGNDTLSGGLGADVLSGGAGVDRVSYSNVTVPVTVTIDNAANDGQSGEADNVKTDVENLSGGTASDHLTGSGTANSVFGGAGNDTLSGLAGNDRLDGQTGTDRAVGGDGTDTCLAENRTTCEH